MGLIYLACVREGHQIYLNCCHINITDYSQEEQNELLNGREIPCERNEQGEPIAWLFLYDND